MKYKGYHQERTQELRDATWTGDVGPQVHLDMEGGMDLGGWGQGQHHAHSMLQPSFFSPVVAICEMGTLRALQLLGEGRFASLILTSAHITEPAGASQHWTPDPASHLGDLPAVCHGVLGLKQPSDLGDSLQSPCFCFVFFSCALFISSLLSQLIHMEGFVLLVPEKTGTLSLK